MLADLKGLKYQLTCASSIKHTFNWAEREKRENNQLQSAPFNSPSCCVNCLILFFCINITFFFFGTEGRLEYKHRQSRNNKADLKAFQAKNRRIIKCIHETNPRKQADAAAHDRSIFLKAKQKVERSPDWRENRCKSRCKRHLFPVRVPVGSAATIDWGRGGV